MSGGMPQRAAPPKEKVYGIPGIQESEVTDTRDAFNFFDQENTGAVDLNELLFRRSPRMILSVAARSTFSANSCIQKTAKRD